MVVWQAIDLDGDLDETFARLLESNGTPVGREFRINTTTDYGQAHPSIAAMPTGGFIVGWSSYAQDGDLGGIFVRIFNGDRLFSSEEIQVNDTTSGHQDFPKIASDPQGNFVVAWTSDDFDGLGSSVYARRFNAQGKPLGPEVLVRLATSIGDHYVTDLSVRKDGGFTVVWSSYDPLEVPLGIFSQSFDSNGIVSGEQVLVLDTATP